MFILALLLLVLLWLDQRSEAKIARVSGNVSNKSKCVNSDISMHYSRHHSNDSNHDNCNKSDKYDNRVPNNNSNHSGGREKHHSKKVLIGTRMITAKTVITLIIKIIVIIVP